MSVWKLVSLLFPFVRDMILGESSLKYALKKNKIRVALLFLLMFCFAWTVYSIPRLIEMAAHQVSLEHRYEALEEKQLPKPNKPQPRIEYIPPKPKDNQEEPRPTPPPAIIQAPQYDNRFKQRRAGWLSSLQ